MQDSQSGQCRLRTRAPTETHNTRLHIVLIEIIIVQLQNKFWLNSSPLARVGDGGVGVGVWLEAGDGGVTRGRGGGGMGVGGA
jgi:hypothetical protein